MPTPLDKLAKILQHADEDFIQKSDFKQVFDMITSMMKELRIHLEGQMSKGDDKACQTMMSDMSAMESKMTKMMSSKITMSDMKEALKGVMATINEIKQTMPTMPDLNVLDGKLSELEASIPSKTISPDELKRELDDLYEELKKYIDSRPKTETSSRPIFGARTGIQVYGGTSKIGTRVSDIVFGNGLSVYKGVDGRINVISLASTSVLTATGTIDDSNMTFTVVSEPSVAIINGAAYLPTGGAITWSYSSGTITLSSPVGVGGALFFLK
jgi:hypothetical protein